MPPPHLHKLLHVGPVRACWWNGCAQGAQPHALPEQDMKVRTNGEQLNFCIDLALGKSKRRVNLKVSVTPISKQLWLNHKKLREASFLEIQTVTGFQWISEKRERRAI